MADFTMLAFIVLAAFVPSLLLMIVVKNTEKTNREPIGSTFGAFLRGATTSIILAVVIEYLLVYLLLNTDVLRMSELLGKHPELATLILACVIAPFTEELTKALGMLPYARRAKELEDGIVYGAAVGLGFAATENLLYESSAYISGGVAVLIGTVIVRTISSALLHASASSITGYGLVHKKFTRNTWVTYYLMAVLLHSVFNLAASAGPLLESTSVGDYGYFIGLGAAIAIGVGAFSWSRHKIRAIENSGAFKW
jgi:RsiW-degrading membrane proteinase PrsW (M82 family)